MISESLSTAAFWKAAGMRALWTFAQTFLAIVGTSNAGVFNSSALANLVTALTAAVLSVLKSIVFGIPEADGAIIDG